MIKGLTATNWKKRMVFMPTEDSYLISENRIFAVADGVTRDPIPNLPDLSNPFGQLKFALKYPKPSPAKIASDIFCDTFVSALKDFKPWNRNEKAIKSSFAYANKKIKEWNDQNIPTCDYITRDFAGCVAVGTCQIGDLVYFGHITDSGVAIFDKEGNLSFRTKDESPHRLDKHIWQDPQIAGKTWSSPGVRARIRSQYRNNPDEQYSFGVLTGEESAMYYVRAGVKEIRPNETLILYTDGLEPIIFSDDFSAMLKNKDINGLEKLCKKEVKTEGTLIYST